MAFKEHASLRIKTGIGRPESLPTIKDKVQKKLWSNMICKSQSSKIYSLASQCCPLHGCKAGALL